MNIAEMNIAEAYNWMKVNIGKQLDCDDGYSYKYDSSKGFMYWHDLNRKWIETDEFNHIFTIPEPKMKEVDLEEAMRWSINRLNRGLKNVFFDQNDAENHMFHYVRGDGLYMDSNSLALTMKLFNTAYLIPEDE